MSERLPMLFKKSGHKIVEWEILAEKVGGSGVIITRYGYAGGRKQELKEVITTGKNIGKKNQTSAYEQACAEALARWNKQKDRKGYALNAEDSAATRAASPMLAHVYEKHRKKVDWHHAFAQPKLDGFRLMARVEGNKVTLLSRENQPMAALTAIRDVIADIQAPDDKPFILDGEAYAHGLALNEISSACKKKSALTDKIQYHIYDSVLDADFEARNAFVKDFVSKAGSCLLVPVGTVKVRDEDELMFCQREFLEAGYEGAMLRFSKAGYQAGKRSDKLLKVKVWVDGEFEIVDFKMCRGKYENCPTFVCQTDEGHPFDVLAPGTVEEKKALGAVAASCIGRKLTIRYQYLTKTAEPVPFLPVAKCFRD